MLEKFSEQKALRIFFLIIFSFASSISLAQSITLSEKDATLEKVFRDIRRQSGLNFFYEYSVIERAGKISIEIKNASVDETLSECLKNTNLTYSIVGKTVAIKLNPSTIKSHQLDEKLNIHGKVLDENGLPLAGVTITIKGTSRKFFTNEHGEFDIKEIENNTVLVFSSINTQSFEYSLDGQKDFTVRLKYRSTELGQVSVQLSNGYQTIPKDRSTGSYEFIDSKLIERSVSPDLMSRLQFVTSGLLYDNQNFSIRGRSTILSNRTPLIVVDNFEYSGDINNINPNDVENVTILKDAAAASIWGAKAGNGVIVITTKKGKYNQKPHVTLNSNFSFIEKPNLLAQPLMTSGDYINTEKFLYQNGYYQYYIGFPNYFNFAPVTPVALLLDNVANGIITQAEADKQISTYEKLDVRNDFQKYFYRNAFLQQHSLSLSGGSDIQHYYVSVGYDDNKSNLVGNANNRITVDASNTYSLAKNKIDVTTRLVFTQTRNQNNGFSYNSSIYPYAQFADSKGNPLPLLKYTQSFLDTAGQGKFLDWSYYPIIDQKLNNNILNGQDLQANLSVNYRVFKNLELQANYLYAKGSIDGKTLYPIQSFYTRDLINQYSQVNPDGSIYHPIPLGAIEDLNTSNYISQNFRSQINFSKNWNDKHQLNAIAGFEINDVHSTSLADRFYGYDDDHATSIPVDYVTNWTNFVSQNSQPIPNYQIQKDLTDRYVSYYVNAAYTLLEKYTLSASARKNASNLFGVNENQKGIPLWSVGAGWNVSRENFYNWSWLPYLRLRATYGYSGNVDKSVTAFLVTVQNGLDNYQLTQSNVLSPANPLLRWEMDGMFNLGIDFGTKANRISGSLEYYYKNGKDLMGLEQLALSTGVATPTGSHAIKKNSASLEGNGIDLKINSKNFDGKFKWNSLFLFSLSYDHIKDYKNANSTVTDYVFGRNPVIGKPVSALYAYKSTGLDTAGNPIGFLNGKTSTDYSSIISSKDLSSVVYVGPQQPPIYGSLINTFGFGNLSVSVNITYRFGYYFLKPSINYATLFNGTVGSKDFENRWQKPGDEKKTNVPGMIYPDDPQRDQFYQYSSVLAEKGDNIRLQDLQINYDFNKSKISKLPFENVRLYCFITNLGIIWKANKDHLDPNTAPFASYPEQKQISFGCKIDF